MSAFNELRLLEIRSPKELGLSQAEGDAELGQLLYACAWVADALRHSMTSLDDCPVNDLKERAGDVAKLLFALTYKTANQVWREPMEP
jgi:hypothetical protein